MFAWNLLLPDGKSATEPLFVLTAITVILLISALLKATRKRSLAVALIAVLALAALGTDFTADLLLQSLSVPSPQSGRPEVIVVAAGGMVLGASRDLDVLSSETESRVATGVAAWRQHPSAKLVMAGTESSDPRLAGRMVSLMRDRAVSFGVPAAVILLDPRSLNTREHAQRLREMPGITRATRVGVTSSYWHMRRVARVFRRHFDTVILYPTNPLPMRHSIVSYMPNARALDASTVAIHEWIGIAWYAAHDARDDAFSAVRGAPRLQR